MTIISRVCAEFHDARGAALFAIGPADRMRILFDVPESIRQDPLFDMLVREGTLQVTESKRELKALENDPTVDLAKLRKGENAEEPEQDTVPAETPENDPPAAEQKPSGRKSK